MFLISTPDDKGESSRHIQRINAHSAHIKHNSVASMSIETNSPASNGERATRSRQGLQLPTIGSRTALESQQPHQVTSFDWVLQSTLDPFVTLPIAITTYERGLLHYCLTHGGRVTTAPSSQHVFDPTIYTASHLLHADKMYVLVHLAMGELMICRRRRIAASALAYHWRVKAYQYMSGLLASTNSPFLTRISGLFQLAIMEQVFCEFDLQASHVKALLRFVEAFGGLTQVDSVSTISGPKLGVSFITSFFTFAEIASVDAATFDSAVDRFGHNLRLLSIRHGSLVDDQTGQANREALLLNLRAYVDQLMSAYLNHSTAPYRLRAGAFGFILSLGMSLTVYEMSANASVRFLVRLEQCMLASKNVLSPSSASLCPIESIPCSALWLLGYVRSCALYVLGNKETKLSQSLLDGLRLLCYMSHADILWLSTSITQSVFGMTDKDTVVFPEAEIEKFICRLKACYRRSDEHVA